MKRVTSIFVVLIIGLCVLSCNKRYSDEDSSISDKMATLNIDANNLEPNNVTYFISDSNFSALKLVTDDDREL